MLDGFLINESALTNRSQKKLLRPGDRFPPARYALQLLDEKNHDWRTVDFLHMPGKAQKHVVKTQRARLLDLEEGKIIPIVHPETAITHSENDKPPNGKSCLYADRRFPQRRRIPQITPDPA